jgi:hypothetical protein
MKLADAEAEGETGAGLVELKNKKGQPKSRPGHRDVKYVKALAC